MCMGGWPAAPSRPAPSPASKPFPCRKRPAACAHAHKLSLKALCLHRGLYVQQLRHFLVAGVCKDVFVWSFVVHGLLCPPLPASAPLPLAELVDVSRPQSVHGTWPQIMAVQQAPLVHVPLS